MRTPDALGFAARPTGPTTGSEFPRSTWATGSSSVDRPVERDKDSRKDDDAADFEQSLNGLVAAGSGTVCGPVSANAPASDQKPPAGASSSGGDDPMPAGAPSAVCASASASPNEPGSASFATTGTSANPVGPPSTEMGAVAVPTFSDESHSLVRGPISAGDRSASSPSAGMSLSEPDHPSLPQVGLPEQPDGTVAAESGPTGTPALGDVTASARPPAIPGGARSVIDAPVNSPLSEPENHSLTSFDPPMKPVEPAPTGPIAATDATISDDRTSTATDRFGPPVLTAALAEKLRDNVPITDASSSGDLNANGQPAVAAGPRVDSSTGVMTSDPSASNVPVVAQKASTAGDAAPALVASGPATFEKKPETHDDQLWRIELASTAQSSLASQSDVASGDLDHESSESDQESQTAGIDSLYTNIPAIDKTNNALNGIPARHDSAPGATVADQVFGEIATRVELSHRDGKIDFRMRLDPPGLGTVHVHLISTGNAVTAQLVVNDEAARQAVESQLHTLRESLAGLGVTLQGSFVARDGGGAGGNRQWQPPQPPSATPEMSIRRFAKHPIVLSSRPAAGVIDVVV